jgi:hypothetical protein
VQRGNQLVFSVAGEGGQLAHHALFGRAWEGLFPEKPPLLFFSVKRKVAKENQLIPRYNAGISWFFLLLRKVDGLPIMRFSGGVGRGLSPKSRLPKIRTS